MSKPTLRQAIDAMCHCCYGDVFGIANCDRYECPLHSVRPNQSLKGQFLNNYDISSLRQQVEDALSFRGLKEKGLEYL